MPNCHSKDQYADACEVCSNAVYAPTDLINPTQPHRRAAGAENFRTLLLPALRPAVRGIPRAVARHAGRLQPQVATRRGVARGQRRAALERLGHLARRALFRIPIPDAPGKYFYVWLDAPIGYLAALKSYLPRQGARNGEPRSFEEFLTAPTPSRSTSSARDIIYFHTLFGRRMLRFAGPPYRVPDHVYVQASSPSRARRCRSRGGTGSVRCATSKSA